VAGDGLTWRSTDLLVGCAGDHLEWIQKAAPRPLDARLFHGAVTDTILRRMHDYVHYITPQFSRTHINFQPRATVDTSNPSSRASSRRPTRASSSSASPTRAASTSLPAVDAARLVHVPSQHDRGAGRQDDLAMQTIFTPMIWRLMERKKQLSSR